MLRRTESVHQDLLKATIHRIIFIVICFLIICIRFRKGEGKLFEGIVFFSVLSMYV